MTDATPITATTPLKITIYPQSAAPGGGRVVNANATTPNVPDSPNFWGEGGASFKSFLDTVNPLQHIPVVSTLYQAMTGDVPSSGSNIAGGALFGGPIGMMASIANEISKTQTGKSISGNMLSLVQGSAGTQVAQNTDSGSSSFLGPNQRAAYNAYVKTQQNISASS